MSDDPAIGARLRALRRWRGMTLAELAGQAGLSTSFLSRVERGERMLDRRSHLSALAAALRVSETELIGRPHLGTDPVQSGPHSVVPLLRAALTANTLQDPNAESARPLGELQSLLFGPLARLRDTADYLRRGELVAPVIDELHFHVATGDERERRLALELLIEACDAAGMTLRHVGYPDLAYLAAARAVDAAALLELPLLTGRAAYLRALTMPKPKGWERPLAIATRAAQDLQGQLGGRPAAETYGMLHLTAALSAAAAHRHETAADHLAEARNVATRIGEHRDAWCAFGPLNVGIWEVAIAMEQGDYDRAVRVGEPLADATTKEPGRLPNVERRAWLQADTGRAMAHLKGRRADAVGHLQAAERLAPQRIRNSPSVHETVLYLLGRHMVASPGRELRGMAARMAVPH